MSTEYRFGFEKLDVWRQSKDLSVMIYRLAGAFPQQERYGLISQITRADVSVPSNIAEGSGRVSLKERAHFYQIAYGSLMETLSHLYISKELGYINDEDLASLRSEINAISNKLNALHKSTAGGVI